MSEQKLTPMFQQYMAIKEQYPDTLLLYRMGDFYEMFGQDAEIAARELDLTLTARQGNKNSKIPMAGVPYHAIERYLAQLIAKGYRAAICDQIEDPKQAKGLVKRAVTRVVTPGTVLEDSMLEARANNFLCALAGDGRKFGMATVDVSTGEFVVTEIAADSRFVKLRDELTRLQPAECLVPSEWLEDGGIAEKLRPALPTVVTGFDLDPLALRSPYEQLARHFGTTSLRGFGCEDLPLAIEAAARVLAYLAKNHLTAVEHIRGLHTYTTDDFMTLDEATRRNLELVKSIRDGSPKGSLIELLDHTGTTMGARMLRQWLLQPLLDVEPINRRLDAVAELTTTVLLREDLTAALQGVYDLERLVSKAATGTANARDLVALRLSLERLPGIADLLHDCEAPFLCEIRDRLDPCDEVRDLLGRSLADDPPVTLREGHLIRAGYHEEVDRLRRAGTEGKGWIASLEQMERERTGIKSLKVGFNQVFGYYIEVTRANDDLVPPDYIRKQTLANAERYITPALKEYESQVLGAEERVVELEYRLFLEIRDQVTAAAARILATARAVAELDMLVGFAVLATRNRYVRPAVHDGDGIRIRDGRHPVVEQMMPGTFVPNDVELDAGENQVLIVTGPNMAGKSTYLRQTALIVLLAQIGCFVPAAEADIGVVDRIFTRVGAHDDLATGQSTFMVEMNEAANILHNATARSLVILDEIGRGTSTYDGLSIAWAVAEHLHDCGAKTIFATHYHHLNELQNHLPRVNNFRVEVSEEGDVVTFLHRIVRGGADRSYGIQVARLAGLPQSVIERAKQVLWTLEEDKSIGQIHPDGDRVKKIGPPVQLTLFEVKSHPVLEALLDMDIEELTPLQAMNKLAELKAKASDR